MVTQVGGVEVGAYLSLIGRRRGWAWAWALINFFCLWDERLFKVGANSRLGPYSNKYGSSRKHFLAFGSQLIYDYNNAPSVIFFLTLLFKNPEERYQVILPKRKRIQ